MRAGCVVALVGLVAMAVGCGGEKKQAVDTAPFEAALVEHLRAGSMDMKPDKFESIKVEGDKATARVRMATKGDLYGMKPLWTVTFKKSEDAWEVARVDR